jgi:triosephosphate isomerase (TIM)
MTVLKKIIVANWKMNPCARNEAEGIVNSIIPVAKKLKNTQVIICPPSIYLDNLITQNKVHKNVHFGAQNCFYENKGAYTGEISAQMILNSGAEYVILGHSERRALGETDEDINKKMLSVIKHGLTPILCVGEKQRDPEGAYLGFIKQQIVSALSGISRHKANNILIAYEPIWAIGKDQNSAMLPDDIQEMSIYIRKILKDIYKSKGFLDTPLLYGGSVAPENTAEIVRNGDLCGLLVGHKSLEPDKFGDILLIVDRLLI